MTRWYRYVRMWPRSGGGSRDLSCSNQGAESRCASLQGSDSAGHTAPARKRRRKKRNREQTTQDPSTVTKPSSQRRAGGKKGTSRVRYSAAPSSHLKGERKEQRENFCPVLSHPSFLFTSPPEVFFRSPPPPSSELSLAGGHPAAPSPR